MNHPFHCITCRKKTTSKNITGHRTSNGRAMLKATCGSCGRRKCTMVGEGFFGGVLKGMSSVFNNSALHSIAGMIPGGSASVPIIKGLGKLTDLGHHL